MSLPAVFSSSAVNAIAAISPLDSVLHIFNTNPYFIGLMMLVLNLGGRFIGLEVTKKQEQFLQHPWVRRVLIFTVLFVATRSIWVAFWTTVIVVFLLGYLFNEESALCIFGEGGSSGSTCSKENKVDDMTPEEKEILHRLSSKAQRYQITKEDDSKSDVEDVVLHTDVYAANLSLLRR
jgi:hypothetical protein